MEAKDSRIKIINEIIAGVKVEFITSILSLEYYPCREKVRPNSFYFSYIGESRKSSQGLLSFFFFFFTLILRHIRARQSASSLSHPFTPIGRVTSPWSVDTIHRVFVVNRCSLTKSLPHPLHFYRFACIGR